MPLVRIDCPAGVNAQAVSSGVHRALVATFNVPEDDLFHIVTQQGPGVQIVHPPSYLGIQYSDGFTVVQITCNDTRTVEQKKTLYKTIADNLARDAGLRKEDVFINIVEVKKENWSFGLGLAQYA
jgi:phenylpyruvate tautomerase PptA (4-oxalocrotonate tautomerase family)